MLTDAEVTFAIGVNQPQQLPVLVFPVPKIISLTVFFVHVCCATLCPPHDFSEAFSKLTFCFTSAPPSLYYPVYTGSEENIDISVLGLQSKLNLPFKHPPTHSHKPKAYARRPGHSCSDHIHVDGAYLCDGAVSE